MSCKHPEVCERCQRDGAQREASHAAALEEVAQLRGEIERVTKERDLNGLLDERDRLRSELADMTNQRDSKAACIQHSTPYPEEAEENRKRVGTLMARVVLLTTVLSALARAAQTALDISWPRSSRARAALEHALVDARLALRPPTQPTGQLPDPSGGNHD